MSAHLLTTAEAAAHCSVSLRTFTRWCKDEGVKPDRRVGRGKRARYFPQTLDGLMRVMADRPKTSPARAHRAPGASLHTPVESSSGDRVSRATSVSS